MENHLNRSNKNQVKYWWTSLLVGILAIVVGILSVAEPVMTIGILTLFFIANFLVSGLAEVLFALTNRKQIDRWGWMLTAGVINIAFACILLAFPIANMLVFIYYVSFYILLLALLGIWASFSLKQLNVRGWKSHMALAVLGLVLALLLILKPMFAANFITIIFAITLICYGIFRIKYSFKLREIHKSHN